VLILVEQVKRNGSDLFKEHPLEGEKKGVDKMTGIGKSIIVVGFVAGRPS